MTNLNTLLKEKMVMAFMAIGTLLGSIFLLNACPGFLYEAEIPEELK